MDVMTALEALGHLVTILGLPLGIWIFAKQQREARQNEENALHRQLSEEYDSFLRLALENADLQLLRGGAAQTALTEEQRERQTILFRILVSVFEKAFIIVHDDDMTEETKRLWLSWEDDMREWCARPEFRAQLGALLAGEDEAFARHILRIAEREAAQ